MLLASRIDDLLDPLLTVDSDDEGSFDYQVEPPPLETTEKLENVSCCPGDDGDDYNEHVLMMENRPSLTKFTVCEDTGFLPESEQFGTLGIYLGNNTHLKELTFGYVVYCTKYDFEEMCHGLARNKSITKLRFTSKAMFQDSNWLRLLAEIYLQKGNIDTIEFVPKYDELMEERTPIEIDRRGLLLISYVMTKFDSLKKIVFDSPNKGKELNDEAMTLVIQALIEHHPEVKVELHGTTLGPNSEVAALGLSHAGVGAGMLCCVKGLSSEGGKKLNGKRCAVIRRVEGEGRYEVRVEGKPSTFALKESALAPLPRMPLPTHSSRGSSRFPSARSLCELLLYYKGSGPGRDPDFSPSRIFLSGFAATQLNDDIGSSNLLYLVDTQIEQLAGVVGLASICEDGEKGAEKVLFALLEGDEMYVDVLIQTMHWTGFIGSEDEGEDCRDEFHNIPPWELTGDQETKQYCKLMSTGPLLLLVEMTRYKFGTALFEALKRSEFYHLLVQRLLRLIAREAIGTRDGKRLGPMARKILSKLSDLFNLRQPVSKSVADKLLNETEESPCGLIREDGTITAEMEEVLAKN